MLTGITIQLSKKTAGDPDPFGNATYTEELVNVDDVLVGQPTSDDITTTLQLYGKMAVYTLGIPKGDTNDWVDTEVVLPEPFAGRYRTIGYPTAGIEANIPLRWNKQIKVERYG